jgi:hypothetical protein
MRGDRMVKTGQTFLGKISKKLASLAASVILIVKSNDVLADSSSASVPLAHQILLNALRAERDLHFGYDHFG